MRTTQQIFALAQKAASAYNLDAEGALRTPTEAVKALDEYAELTRTERAACDAFCHDLLGDRTRSVSSQLQFHEEKQ